MGSGNGRIGGPNGGPPHIDGDGDQSPVQTADSSALDAVPADSSPDQFRQILQSSEPVTFAEFAGAALALLSPEVPKLEPADVKRVLKRFIGADLQKYPFLKSMINDATLNPRALRGLLVLLTTYELKPRHVNSVIDVSGLHYAANYFELAMDLYDAGVPVNEISKPFKTSGKDYQNPDLLHRIGTEGEQKHKLYFYRNTEGGERRYTYPGPLSTRDGTRAEVDGVYRESQSDGAQDRIFYVEDKFATKFLVQGREEKLFDQIDRIGKLVEERRSFGVAGFEYVIETIIFDDQVRASIQQIEDRLKKTGQPYRVRVHTPEGVKLYPGNSWSGYKVKDTKWENIHQKDPPRPLPSLIAEYVGEPRVDRVPRRRDVPYISLREVHAEISELDPDVAESIDDHMNGIEDLTQSPLLDAETIELLVDGIEEKYFAVEEDVSRLGLTEEGNRIADQIRVLRGRIATEPLSPEIRHDFLILTAGSNRFHSLLYQTDLRHYAADEIKEIIRDKIEAYEAAVEENERFLVNADGDQAGNAYDRLKAVEARMAAIAEVHPDNIIFNELDVIYLDALSIPHDPSLADLMASLGYGDRDTSLWDGLVERYDAAFEKGERQATVLRERRRDNDIFSRVFEQSDVQKKLRRINKLALERTLDSNKLTAAYMGLSEIILPEINATLEGITFSPEERTAFFDRFLVELDHHIFGSNLRVTNKRLIHLKGFSFLCRHNMERRIFPDEVSAEDTLRIARQDAINRGLFDPTNPVHVRKETLSKRALEILGNARFESVAQSINLSLHSLNHRRSPKFAVKKIFKQNVKNLINSIESTYPDLSPIEVRATVHKIISHIGRSESCDRGVERATKIFIDDCRRQGHDVISYIKCRPQSRIRSVFGPVSLAAVVAMETMERNGFQRRLRAGVDGIAGEARRMAESYLPGDGFRQIESHFLTDSQRIQAVRQEIIAELRDSVPGMSMDESQFLFDHLSNPPSELRVTLRIGNQVYRDIDQGRAQDLMARAQSMGESVSFEGDQERIRAIVEKSPRAIAEYERISRTFMTRDPLFVQKPFGNLLYSTGLSILYLYAEGSFEEAQALQIAVDGVVMTCASLMSGDLIERCIHSYRKQILSKYPPAQAQLKLSQLASSNIDGLLRNHLPGMMAVALLQLIHAGELTMASLSQAGVGLAVSHSISMIVLQLLTKVNPIFAATGVGIIVTGVIDVILAPQVVKLSDYVMEKWDESDSIYRLDRDMMAFRSRVEDPMYSRRFAEREREFRDHKVDLSDVYGDIRGWQKFMSGFTFDVDHYDPTRLERKLRGYDQAEMMASGGNILVNYDGRDASYRMTSHHHRDDFLNRTKKSLYLGPRISEIMEDLEKLHKIDPVLAISIHEKIMAYQIRMELKARKNANGYDELTYKAKLAKALTQNRVVFADARRKALEVKMMRYSTSEIKEMMIQALWGDDLDKETFDQLMSLSWSQLRKSPIASRPMNTRNIMNWDLTKQAIAFYLLKNWPEDQNSEEIRRPSLQRRVIPQKQIDKAISQMI